MIKVAAVFVGQGAQCLGMGQDIFDAYPEARMVFEEANERLGRDIRTIMFQGPEEELNATINTQPCMLTVEVATYAVLRAKGIMPDLVAGFSLGEWAALVAEEVVPFSTALDIVQLRARAMQAAVPQGEGAMAAILGKDAAFVEDLCKRADGYVVPSNYNCPGQITVAGEAKGIHSLISIAEEEGVVVKKLPISIPSHCKLMEPAAHALAEAMTDIPFSSPAMPIIMNATGQPEVNPERIKHNVIAQLTSPVRFEASLLHMMDMGAEAFLEIGPGKTLSGFVKKTAKAAGRDVMTQRCDTLASLNEVIEAQAI